MGKPEKPVTIKEETGDVKQSHMSATLSSSQADDNGTGPVPWDAEEDHLLSYFLEGDAHNVSHQRHRSDNDVAAAVAVVASNAVAFHPGQYKQHTHAFTYDDDENHRNHHPGAPVHVPPRPTTMTPAVHFYAPPPPFKPNTNTSLSSMASMAAALVGGGPISSSSSSHNQGENDHDHEDATISPTAIMITNQSPENLMLPCGPQTEAEKQQHLMWLQHINVMAQMARQPSGVAGYPPVHPLHATATAIAAAAAPPPAAAAISAAAAAVAETEEKRARRLARNRESARQSRRRKKERLTTLESKVTSLFGELEKQRRSKMMEMESQLRAVKGRELEALDDTTTTTGVTTREQLFHFLQETGCNHPVRERVIQFQLEKLRQLLLPRHEKVLLWLTLQPDAFFTRLKDDQRAAILNKTGRISSKQIGEELTNEFNKLNTDEDEKLFSSNVSEIWPLFCFEMLFSVDQEERLVLTQKRNQQSPTISENRAKMALATKMVELTKKGVLFQAHAASMRTHTTLLEILTPEQSVKFLKYMAANRPAARPSRTQSNDATLEDICRRLDQVLRLG